jgi:predicted membrane protein
VETHILSRKAQLLRRAASERGEGKFKAILVTVILAFFVYFAVKVVPPYVSEYQLSDKIQETARYASVTRSSEDQIRETIFREIQDLNIPATKEDVKVSAVSGRVSITVDYTVPIDLTVYKFDLHFTPSSSNKDII